MLILRGMGITPTRPTGGGSGILPGQSVPQATFTPTASAPPGVSEADWRTYLKEKARAAASGEPPPPFPGSGDVGGGGDGGRSRLPWIIGGAALAGGLLLYMRRRGAQ